MIISKEKLLQMITKIAHLQLKNEDQICLKIALS